MLYYGRQSNGSERDGYVLQLESRSERRDELAQLEQHELLVLQSESVGEQLVESSGDVLLLERLLQRQHELRSDALLQWRRHVYESAGCIL